MEEKRNPYKVWFVVGCCVFLLGSCMNMVASDNKSNPVPPPAAPVVAEVKQPAPPAETWRQPVKTVQSEPVKTPPPAQAVPTKPSEEVMAEGYLEIMRSNFSGLARIDFEYVDGVPVYTINPTNPALKDMVAYMLMGDMETVAAWIDMTEGIQEMSLVMSKGLNNHMVVFSNPINLDNALYIVMNGVTMYDFIYD